ncbi:sensor histidine kinase [Streptomyces xanthophaeus]
MTAAHRPGGRRRVLSQVRPLRLLRSERARLTTLYGSLLVLAGGGLVALVYVLVGGGLLASVSTAVMTAGPGTLSKAVTPGANPGAGVRPPPTPAQTLPPGQRPDFVGPAPDPAAIQKISDAATDAMLGRLLWVSLIALAVFAVLSVWLAWWMAGRVLRPVGVITETARRLSGENLHERIALQGPPGELKRLADTFDGMLDRMQDLVAAQRRFAANAAHELRTPLAVQRAAAEIGLAGHPPPERVARIREKLIDNADAAGHLVESLLLLAASEEPLETTAPVELAELAAAELACCDQEEVAVVVEHALVPVTVRGDRVLLGHLVRNLLVNAVRHNHEGGRLTLATAADGRLTVTNTGPVIDPADVPRLLEPFRRRAERRHAPGEGAGLGLSIVASIARTHGAELAVEANPAPVGGLTITVRLPAHRPPEGAAVHGEREVSAAGAPV